MICAGFDATTGAVVTVSPQPADLSTCAVVLIPGSEVSAISGISIPTPADFGTAWAFGFSLVVGSYLIGWAVGAVLRFVK